MYIEKQMSDLERYTMCVQPVTARSTFVVYCDTTMTHA